MTSGFLKYDGRNMTEPTLTDMKRSLLLQLLQYNFVESSLQSELHVRAMSDEEVNAKTNVLLEMSNDLNELRDRIEAAEARKG